MDLGIAGKWALVGGASKGLGYGCAQALAREGVNVVMVARGAEALQAAAAKLRAENKGVDVLAVPVDITTPAGREAIFAQRQDFDIVVTNAGGPPLARLRAHQVVDAVVRYRQDDIELALGVNNLFDERYSTLAFSQTYYPMPGRQAHTTLSVRF